MARENGWGQRKRKIAPTTNDAETGDGWEEHVWPTGHEFAFVLRVRVDYTTTPPTISEAFARFIRHGGPDAAGEA